MSAPSTTLEHLGVPYDDSDHLIETVGPRVADAVADGTDVYLSVDRRTARGFRRRLGRAARQVEFPSPTEWPADFVRTVQTHVRPGRPALILGQYTAVGPGIDLPDCEDGANLVLGDLPLTLLCSCPRDAEPALLDSMRTGHPALLVDGRVLPNPDYRPPAPSCPVAADQWGPMTSRLDFTAPADLRRLREHVTRAAETLGLRGEVLRESVLAIHEAAVLAAGLPDPDVTPAGAAIEAASERAVPCVLEVRTAAGVLHCEVSGPHPGEPDGRADEQLRIVRMFCDRAVLHDAGDVRRIRVLRAPGVTS